MININNNLTTAVRDGGRSTDAGWQQDGVRVAGFRAHHWPRLR